MLMLFNFLWFLGNWIMGSTMYVQDCTDRTESCW